MPHHFLVSNFHFFPTFLWVRTNVKRGRSFGLENTRGKEGALLRLYLSEKVKYVGGKEPLWLLALESSIASKAPTIGFCNFKQKWSNATKLLESWRVYVDPTLLGRKKLFLLKWGPSSLGRERAKTTDSTCNLSVDRHSLHPKMGTV